MAGTASPKPRAKRTLARAFPALAREWHPSKNGELTPEDVGPMSIKRVWWRCRRDPKHVWCTGVGNRAQGKGCPYCSGRLASAETSLRKLHPRLARQWHPTKNGDLRPTQVRPGSNRRVWWQCKHGHEWRASIASRVVGMGCAFCSGRRASPDTSLAALRPALAREWNREKNGTLRASDVRPRSGKKVWWRCGRGHEWEAVIANRSVGRGCPFCSGNRVAPDTSLAARNPDLARQWHPTKNKDLSPEQVTPGSGKVVWWQCSTIARHAWEQSVNHRNRNDGGCPYCRAKRRRYVRKRKQGKVPLLLR